MKKVKILIPVYNDWESLIKLLDEINKVISDIKNTEFDCMIVNDASTIKLPEIKVPKNKALKQMKSIKSDRTSHFETDFIFEFIVFVLLLVACVESHNDSVVFIYLTLIC